MLGIFGNNKTPNKRMDQNLTYDRKQGFSPGVGGSQRMNNTVMRCAIDEGISPKEAPHDV
jgi:hypothetical protein